MSPAAEQVDLHDVDPRPVVISPLGEVVLTALGRALVRRAEHLDGRHQRPVVTQPADLDVPLGDRLVGRGDPDRLRHCQIGRGRRAGQTCADVERGHVRDPLLPPLVGLSTYTRSCTVTNRSGGRASAIWSARPLMTSWWTSPQAASNHGSMPGNGLRLRSAMGGHPTFPPPPRTPPPRRRRRATAAGRPGGGSGKSRPRPSGRGRPGRGADDGHVRHEAVANHWVVGVIAVVGPVAVDEPVVDRRPERLQPRVHARQRAVVGHWADHTTGGKPDVAGGATAAYTGRTACPRTTPTITFSTPRPTAARRRRTPAGPWPRPPWGRCSRRSSRFASG